MLRVLSLPRMDPGPAPVTSRGLTARMNNKDSAATSPTNGNAKSIIYSNICITRIPSLFKACLMSIVLFSASNQLEIRESGLILSLESPRIDPDPSTLRRVISRMNDRDGASSLSNTGNDEVHFKSFYFSSNQFFSVVH